MAARASLVRLIQLLSVLSCYANPLFADPVVYSATDFGDPLWDTTVIYESGVTGSVSGWHVETGGHTGAFRECRVTLDAGGPGAVWGFHRCIPFTYSPRTQGAIDWIDYSAYAISIDPPGYGHNTGPAIRQEGVVYVVSGLFTYETSWTYKSLTKLVASDFCIVGDPSSPHPDFSATAPPFEMGFVTGHSTKISQHGSRDVDIGIDNWTFVVNPVPEPFSLAFMASAFVGVVAYRLRKRHRQAGKYRCPSYRHCCEVEAMRITASVALATLIVVSLAWSSQAVADPTLTDNLLVNPGFETPVSLPAAMPTDFGYWSHDVAETVGASSGIAPFEGSRMLKFVYTAMYGPSPSGGSCEVYQLVDLGPYQTLVQSGLAYAVGSAIFNRVQGDAQTDTMFGMDIRVYAGLPSTFASQINISELAMSSGVVISDGSVSTWESLGTTLRIPFNTDFLAVRIYAGENVFNDSVAPEFDGHYADAVSLRLGVVPEPISLAFMGSAFVAVVACRLRRRPGSRTR